MCLQIQAGIRVSSAKDGKRALVPEVAPGSALLVFATLGACCNPATTNFMSQVVTHVTYHRLCEMPHLVLSHRMWSRVERIRVFIAVPKVNKVEAMLSRAQ